MTTEQSIPLQTRSLTSLLTEDSPSRERLLGDGIIQRDLIMTYAPTGVGKSMFSLSVALAVAGGGSFLGWQAEKPRKVLLVDAEMDACDLKDRSSTLLAALPDVDPVEAGGNLMWLIQQEQHPDATFPDLTDEEHGHTEIMRLAKQHEAELVILDNLSTMATFEDENAAPAIDPVLALMKRLRQDGRAVLLVHHSRKGNSGEGSYRGSSKLVVPLDGVIALSRPDNTPIGGTAFVLKWEKFRRERTEDVQDREAELTKDDTSDRSQWNWRNTDYNRLQILASLMHSRLYTTQAELIAPLAERLKIKPVSAGTMHALIGQVCAAGLMSDREWAAAKRTARETREEAEVTPTEDESDF